MDMMMISIIMFKRKAVLNDNNNFISLNIVCLINEDKWIGTDDKKVNNKYQLHILYSPLHSHAILLWHLDPGLLKSHAAQVSSSTMADGYKKIAIQKLLWELTAENT